MIEYNEDYINWSEHDFTCAFYKFKKLFTLEDIWNSGINASTITRARRKYVNNELKTKVNETIKQLRTDRENEFKNTMKEAL